ncbi:MAG TPA: hypothetical protein VGQ28_18540 [Thermoanaerobaculia bacterium]|nr:hypothetical protein [Thermoanaerobaculia bacterium]
MRVTAQPGSSLLRTALAALLGVAILASPAGARDSHWRSFVPGGGTITALALDPVDPRVVYAAAFDDLFVSRDGGQTWRGFSLPSASTVAVAPGSPSVLYAGASQIFRSGDGGRTWKTVLDEPGLLSLQALAVTPGQRPVVFALGEKTLWRSADDGQTWTTPFFTSYWQIDSLAVDPVSPAVAYVADRTGVFRSADSGITWAKILDLDLSAGASVLVAVAPSSPRTLYAVASRSGPAFSVYRSEDGGQTWAKIRDREGFYERALIVDPGSPTTLYLGGFNGLLGSFDGGRVWIPLSTGMPKDMSGGGPGVLSLAISPRQRRTVFAGLYGPGVARSDNRGGTWSIPVQTGLDAATDFSIFFNPLRSQEVFSLLDYRVLRSRDDGSTWSYLTQRIAALGVYTLAFDGVDPNLAYAATGSGVWRTRNDGASWSKLTAENFYQVTTAGPGVLLASGLCGLSRSLDGGLTWAVALPCSYDDFFSQGIRGLWVGPGAPDAIYALVSLFTDTHPYSSLILASTDRGATWRQLTVPDSLRFTVAPGDSRVLYSWDDSTAGGLQSSHDGGSTWQAVQAQPPAGEPYGRVVADPRDPNLIYIGTPTRVLRSRDGGRTLEVLDPSFDAGELITDRARPGFLYARGGRFELRVD